MKRHLISVVILIAYGAVLIKVMVFKDIPTIKIGHIMLNFAGTDTGYGPNFVPFKTILPYLFGYKGLIIAGVNLVGNVALLIPVGLLIPLVYRDITWKKSFTIAVAAGFSIEVMQTILRVGIFDIDDVILNALGVMIGYWTFVILARWIREKNYKNIVIAAVVAIAAASLLYVMIIYPISHQPVTPPRGGVDEQQGEVRGGEDPCGGTGGTGQIVSVVDHKMTLKLNDGTNQAFNLTDKTEIRTAIGLASESDLKIGDRVTLVVYDYKNASAVFVCNEH